MPEPKVWTFFYGSFIDLDVLKEVELVPQRFEVASLNGFEISISPLANLTRSQEHTVYGIVAQTTHTELSRIYDYATNKLGGTYLPEAVLVETSEGESIPALCYIAPELEHNPAKNRYIDHIVEAARKYGFPSKYIERLESFRPS